MTTKFLSFILAFFLAASALRAEVNINSVINSARRDPKNAPAIIAFAAIDNPKALLPILSAAVAAFPDQAVEIVRALLKVAPKQVVEIVHAAVLAQPKLSTDIVTVALAAAPEQAAAIQRTADDAAKNEVETAIASPSDTNLGGGTNSGAPSAPPFPAQPIRPDLVSPSS
jgi:hypothetical protein